MRILHTSDWHLGRSLYGKKRYDEFEAFLNWLVDLISQQEINVLLIAGDIFDTSTPSNRAQELYYRFLCRVAASSGCRHVVIIAGNHDSASFLNAPKTLLKALSVHVVGNTSANIDEEVLVLQNGDDVAELIVCAVPYLRDRDIRLSEPGESVEDKEQKLVDAIGQHYAAVADLAEQKCSALDAPVPIVAMGHLFAVGGQTISDDGVRRLYVGSLAHVNAGTFSPAFDYVALGHLHVPQLVGGAERVRYCGSPLPMGFGEAKQQKIVCQIEFNSSSGLSTTPLAVERIDVPVFQRLERVKGSWEEIAKRLVELSTADCSCWLEIIYNGDDIIGDLRERLEAAVANTRLEILRVKNSRIVDRVLQQAKPNETLDDLDEHDVFERCLALHDVPEEQKPLLLSAYQETLVALLEQDERAE